MHGITTSTYPKLAPSPDAPARPPEQTLWSARRGQISNLMLYVYCLLTAWAILPLFYALYRALATHYCQYELLSDRIRITTGLYRPYIRVQELHFSDVANVYPAGPWFQRLVRRGNVVIARTEGLPLIPLKGLREPRAVARTIRQAIAAARGVGTDAAA